MNRPRCRSRRAMPAPSAADRARAIRPIEPVWSRVCPGGAGPSRLVPGGNGRKRAAGSGRCGSMKG